ncbi:hypothetical protein B0H66DRAFT_631626 [Apodospora peruviana]|uniref:Uncharacterized protein n=1 Tax=Apodospora peruviana TaxID=516989 RepID=A0AAE0LZ01_9PEZI|nr:hypothetical protein B0H66DRAFT_631626 [Apodospora peruviana]
MKATTVFVALAGLFSASLVAATSTNMLAACQDPYNGGKKAGDSCEFIHGVAEGDDHWQGKCFSGAAGGNGLYCAHEAL